MVWNWQSQDFLEEHGVKLIGTTAETIFKAEDRQAFKDTMEKIGEPCAASQVVNNVAGRYQVYQYASVIRSFSVRHSPSAEAAVVSPTMSRN